MGFKMILLESYEWFILFVGFYFGKIWEKRLFFRADMAGLGKYHTGGYGRIGVYRVYRVMSCTHQVLHPRAYYEAFKYYSIAERQK